MHKLTALALCYYYVVVSNHRDILIIFSLYSSYIGLLVVFLHFIPVNSDLTVILICPSINPINYCRITEMGEGGGGGLSRQATLKYAKTFFP